MREDASRSLSLPGIASTSDLGDGRGCHYFFGGLLLQWLGITRARDLLPVPLLSWAFVLFICDTNPLPNGYTHVYFTPPPLAPALPL